MVEPEVLLEIVIHCHSNEEKMECGSMIHEALRGNPDYMADRIILNIDDDKLVRVYQFADSTMDTDTLQRVVDDVTIQYFCKG